MQAANEGAASVGREGSMGIRVELPFEQDVNPFVEQAYELPRRYGLQLNYTF